MHFKDLDLKNCLTILSSIEWKDIIAIRPPLSKTFGELKRASFKEFISSLILIRID